LRDGGVRIGQRASERQTLDDSQRRARFDAVHLGGACVDAEIERARGLPIELDVVPIDKKPGHIEQQTAPGQIRADADFVVDEGIALERRWHRLPRQ
jgi:hypothetical protein